MKINKGDLYKLVNANYEYPFKVVEIEKGWGCVCCENITTHKPFEVSLQEFLEDIKDGTIEKVPELKKRLLYD